MKRKLFGVKRAGSPPAPPLSEGETLIVSANGAVVSPPDKGGQGGDYHKKQAPTRKLSVILLLVISLILGLSSCSKAPRKEDQAPSIPVATNEPETPVFRDTLLTFKVGRYLCDIQFPDTATPVGAILVFPGWNFPRQDWCGKSTLCRKALAKGYALVLPEMGKSNFAARLYPETRPDWRDFPLRGWVADSLINYVQTNYGLLKKGQRNFLVGLSTGGRGVGLIALSRPELFTAAAALSGDFDIRLIPNDNVTRGTYGDAKKFPERWGGEDNTVANAARFQTPIYLGHGLLDQVCPASQSQVFYDTLKKLHPTLPVKLHLDPKAAHTWTFWDSEVNAMLSFFEAQK